MSRSPVEGCHTVTEVLGVLGSPAYALTYLDAYAAWGYISPDDRGGILRSGAWPAKVSDAEGMRSLMERNRQSYMDRGILVNDFCDSAIAIRAGTEHRDIDLETAYNVLSDLYETPKDINPAGTPIVWECAFDSLLVPCLENVVALVDAGFFDGLESQTTLYDADNSVTGTPDYLGRGPDGRLRVVELKCAEVDTKHALQASVYATIASRIHGGPCDAYLAYVKEKPKVVKLSPEQVQAYWDAFMNLLWAFHALSGRKFFYVTKDVLPSPSGPESSGTPTSAASAG